MAPKTFFFKLRMGEKTYPFCQVHCFTYKSVEGVNNCLQDREALTIQENQEFSTSFLTRLNENTHCFSFPCISASFKF